ncbi:MAG: sulfite exporter TauE/SafE family protein [Xanthomonadales bacterium]|nr:sulfite exporter TauE/SafE family protein [Xanthomonadales bacterium]
MNALPAAFAAFVAGLAASAHCLAMCGAISLALARSSPPRAQFVLARQLGRVAAYTLAGAVIGGFGQGLLFVGGNGNARLLLQVVFALSWLWLAARLLRPGLQLPGAARAGSAAWARLQPLTRALLPAHTPLRAFVLGGLWGFLPCGLSYAMLLVAGAQGSLAGGAAVMAAFGIATVLPLSLLDLGGHRIDRARLAPALRWFAAALAIALALLSLWLPLQHRGHAHPTSVWMALSGADYCVP